MPIRLRMLRRGKTSNAEWKMVQGGSDQGFAGRVGGLRWREDHGMINFVNCRADTNTILHHISIWGSKASL
jgi:hypothetical protein